MYTQGRCDGGKVRVEANSSLDQLVIEISYSCKFHTNVMPWEHIVRALWPMRRGPGPDLHWPQGEAPSAHKPKPDLNANKVNTLHRNVAACLESNTMDIRLFSVFPVSWGLFPRSIACKSILIFAYVLQKLGS